MIHRQGTTDDLLAAAIEMIGLLVAEGEDKGLIAVLDARETCRMLSAIKRRDPSFKGDTENLAIRAQHIAQGAPFIIGRSTLSWERAPDSPPPPRP